MTGELNTADLPLAYALKTQLSSPKSAALPPLDDAKASSIPAQPLIDIKSDHAVAFGKTFLNANRRSVSPVIDRRLRFDAKRRAIRVLDIISGDPAYATRLTIQYSTAWQPDIVSRIGTPVEFPAKDGQDPVGVVSAVKDAQSKLPALMFVHGAQPSGWERTAPSKPGAVNWAYTGLLGAGQRIVLLHWLAVIDDARPEAAAEKLGSLIKDGVPDDESLNPDVLGQLINFPITESALPVHPFQPPFVRLLSNQHGLPVHPDHDQVVLSEGVVLQGRFTASGITLNTRGGSRKVGLSEIAAIEGAAGVGRKMRVFFREGTVASGDVAWSEAGFDGASLGSLKLTPEGLDLLLFRGTGSDETSAAAPAGVCMTHDGDVLRLAHIPDGKAELRWAAGILRPEWQQIAGIRQAPPPELGQEVLLRDGSRVRGWWAPPADHPVLSRCATYATTWDDLLVFLNGTPSGKPAPNMRLMTRDGSLLSGTWAEAHLVIVTRTGTLDVPAAGIRRLRLEEKADTGLAEVEILTANGDSPIHGSATSEVLKWNHLGSVIAVPWALVTEVVSPTSPPPTP